MKQNKKILIKALWQSAVMVVVLFFILFIVRMALGERSNDNPWGMGGAPPKFKSISFKDTCKSIPELLIILVIPTIVGFLIHFDYLRVQYKKRMVFEKQMEEAETNKQTIIFTQDIYIPLLDNESYRPIPSIYITETMYKLQGEDLYKQVNEQWQFMPGDTVLVERQHIGNLHCLVAVEKVAGNDYFCTSKSDTDET